MALWDDLMSEAPKNEWLKLLHDMLEDKLKHHVNQPLNEITASMMQEECDECLKEFDKFVREVAPDVEPPNMTATVTFNDGDMRIDLSAEG